MHWNTQLHLIGWFKIWSAAHDLELLLKWSIIPFISNMFFFRIYISGTMVVRIWLHSHCGKRRWLQVHREGTHHCHHESQVRHRLAHGMDSRRATQHVRGRILVLSVIIYWLKLLLFNYNIYHICSRCRYKVHIEMQGTKIYGKSSLRLVPLIGWAWFFAESIFLRREWDKDRETIARDLKYIRDFPDNYWFTVSKVLYNYDLFNCIIVLNGTIMIMMLFCFFFQLLLFCEGTRFTPAKHKLSMDFAARNNLPILKHHLSPRTKGFIHSIYGLKGKSQLLVFVVVNLLLCVCYYLQVN